MEERLQKIMARAGLGSRRDCEVLIRTGRVRVNGIVAVIGAKADPDRDQITVDGAPLSKAESLVYVALHKPRNVLSAVDAPDPRRTVRDLVPLPGTLYPVGRLDAESEGLILLTNDGDLANRLTHPRYGHEKEYRVLVARQPDQQQLEAWMHGVVLEDGYRTAPAQVVVESKLGRGAWLRVILQEGRKRQIREMGMRTGLPVVRIIRVRIGTLELGTLKTGEWRMLSPREVVALKSPAPEAARRRLAVRKSDLTHFQPASSRKSEERVSQHPERRNKPMAQQPAGKPPAGAGPRPKTSRPQPGRPSKQQPSRPGGRTAPVKRQNRRTPR